jgi:hypothetical protein
MPSAYLLTFSANARKIQSLTHQRYFFKIEAHRQFLLKDFSPKAYKVICEMLVSLSRNEQECRTSG